MLSKILALKSQKSQLTNPLALKNQHSLIVRDLTTETLLLVSLILHSVAENEYEWRPNIQPQIEILHVGKAQEAGRSAMEVTQSVAQRNVANNCLLSSSIHPSFGHHGSCFLFMDESFGGHTTHRHPPHWPQGKQASETSRSK